MAALLAVLVLPACNTVVSGNGALSGVPTGGPTMTGAADGDGTTSPPADGTGAEPEVSVFQLGMTGTVTDEVGQPLADITVAEATETTDPPDEFSDPPQGTFLSATVTVVNIGTEVFSVAPFDFLVRYPDGSRIEYGDGSSGVFGYDDILDTADLNPGETLTGTVVFDVDPDVDGQQIVYTDLDGRALGAWMVP